MPEQRHFTTRRGFVAALGFGAVSLYGAWVAYGAAPLPFGGHQDHDGHDGHHGHDEPAGETAPLSPDRFRAEHEAFVARYRQPDGSVAPGVTAMADHGGHQHHDGMSGHDMSGHDMSMSGHDMSGHGMSHADTGGSDVYLLARRWGYDPDTLRLRAGVPYRFRMLSDDIGHGASIQMGEASRIIRLRPDVVTEQTLTFTAPGEYLVYCTVYCGVGHDSMRGRVIVA